MTEPGFGSYWTVNLHAPPGTKRPRKRGRTAKEEEIFNQRGRPRKEEPYHYGSASRPSDAEFNRITKAGRGRHSSPADGYDDDDVSGSLDAPSDADFESEEDMPRNGALHTPAHTPPPRKANKPYASRMPYVPSPSFSTDLHTVPSLSPASFSDDKGEIARLKHEQENLRREVANLQNNEIKLSNALAEARVADCAMKAALREAELNVSEEKAKRIEAERIAGEEEKLRKQVEAELSEVRRRLCIKRSPSP